MDKMSVDTDNSKIEQRRKRVSSLLTQGRTEDEIAHELNVGQATVSRDVTAIKRISQQFIYDLAKSDLAHNYRQCIEGIEVVKRKVWDILRSEQADTLDIKDKLYALKLIKECNESQFALFKDGPSVLTMKSLEERVDKIIESK
jgi:hypothetical protein